MLFWNVTIVCALLCSGSAVAASFDGGEPFYSSDEDDSFDYDDTPFDFNGLLDPDEGHNYFGDGGGTWV